MTNGELNDMKFKPSPKRESRCFKNTPEMIAYYSLPSTPQAEVNDIMFRLGASRSKPMLCDAIAKTILYNRTGLRLPTLHDILHGDDEEKQ